MPWSRKTDWIRRRQEESFFRSRSKVMEHGPMFYSVPRTYRCHSWHNILLATACLYARMGGSWRAHAEDNSVSAELVLEIFGISDCNECHEWIVVRRVWIGVRRLLRVWWRQTFMPLPTSVDLLFKWNYELPCLIHAYHSSMAQLPASTSSTSCTSSYHSRVDTCVMPNYCRMDSLFSLLCLCRLWLVLTILHLYDHLLEPGQLEE